jgi:hypothetical protein
MINPLITDWTHDTYDYGQGNGVMTHTMSIRYENVKYYSGAVGGAHPSESVTGFADPAHYDTVSSSITAPGSNNTVQTQGTIRPSFSGDKQDLQALATGQNTLQNVIGAVGLALVPTAASFLNGALAGSGALTQKLVAGAVGAAAGGVPGAVSAVINAQGGQIFPTPAGVDAATRLRNIVSGG